MDENEQTLLVQLDEALELAFRKAVVLARRVCMGERIYAFILYTSPLLGYAAPCFNTEEALAQVIKENKSIDYWRWSPEEWKYNWQGQEFFESVNEILISIAQSQGYEAPKRQRRWDTFIQVLKRLDSEGVFADAQDRGSVLVNIMWGDQDAVAHLESARELNPMSSYLSFARCQLPILYSLKQEIEQSQSRSTEESMMRVCRCIEQVEADLRDYS
ncbi:DUF4303 domain-containing protein [Aliterella atlantica]|nr:DUF4303 domain-containing protein [Aliterella atlantica]